MSDVAGWPFALRPRRLPNKPRGDQIVAAVAWPVVAVAAVVVQAPSCALATVALDATNVPAPVPAFVVRWPLPRVAAPRLNGPTTVPIRTAYLPRLVVADT